MTNTTTIQQQGSGGDHRYVIAEIDITSLGAVGAESYDPSTIVSLDGVEGGQVLDRENRQHHFEYDADNTQILVWDKGPEVNQKSVDPASQTYSGNSSLTFLANYSLGGRSRLWPQNFNPADPTEANLSVILRAQFHDGTTTDIVNITDGTEQTYENLVDGFGTGDDNKTVDELQVAVKNIEAADTTEDIGATTTEFLAWDADTESGEDVGTVTMLFLGDFSA